MMKHLYFIRHGRQSSKLCNVDVPLSREGQKQAELLRDRLASMSFDIMLTSTLSRAIETGDIINEKLKLEVERYPGLNEIDWGDLTSLTNNERKERYGDFLKERKERNSDLAFPGGENGEDVFSRAYPVIENIVNSNASSILVVTHGGLIRSLIPGLIGMDMKVKLAFAETLENTSITEFVYDPSTSLYTLERLNDYAHLSSHPELLRDNWIKV